LWSNNELDKYDLVAHNSGSEYDDSGDDTFDNVDTAGGGSGGNILGDTFACSACT